MADLAAGRVQPGNGVAPVAGLAADADGILRRGESGAQVTQLRSDLHTLGIRDGRNRELPIEGNFNAPVEQAVRRLQEQHGLAINGRAGPETLEAIRAALDLQHQQRPAHSIAPAAGTAQPNIAPTTETLERRRMIEGDRGQDNAIPAGPAPDAVVPDGSISSLTEGRSLYDPRSPGHPGHALNCNVRGEVARAETGIGKTWDVDSERLTASLFGLASEKGFGADDNLKVGFNRPTSSHGAGELVFVYREGANASPDPYANRAHMTTAGAIGQPVDNIYRQIEVEAQSRQHVSAATQQVNMAEDQKHPVRSA